MMFLQRLNHWVSFCMMLFGVSLDGRSPSLSISQWGGLRPDIQDLSALHRSFVVVLIGSSLRLVYRGTAAARYLPLTLANLSEFLLSLSSSRSALGGTSVERLSPLLA